MVQITWLGHGTFQLQLETGEVFVLDPWTDGNPAYPKTHSFSRVDAILISHGHFDHIHDAVPLAKEYKPKVVCIYETGQWLESKGVEGISAMNKGGTQSVGPVAITMTQLFTAAAFWMRARSFMAVKRAGTFCDLLTDDHSTSPAIRMCSPIWL